MKVEVKTERTVTVTMTEAEARSYKDAIGPIAVNGAAMVLYVELHEAGIKDSEGF